MIKWHLWWYDVLLAGMLILVGAIAWTNSVTYVVPLICSLAVLLAGYLLIRPRLSIGLERTPVGLDYVGAALLVTGLVAGTFFFDAFSALLAFACPVAWSSISGLRRGAIANIIMILAVCAAALLRS
ncbi:MAG: hypothetical protein FWD55_00360, partial [Propionibacteriaceae bacterium]|nr:hypothetical protein [Propionibacteriaceae bacterium]